jgi:hypothetical protein
MMWAAPSARATGARVRVTDPPAAIVPTTGSGIRPGLFEVAVMVSAWPASLAGPMVSPVIDTTNEPVLPSAVWPAPASVPSVRHSSNPSAGEVAAKYRVLPMTVRIRMSLDQGPD